MAEPPSESLAPGAEQPESGPLSRTTVRGIGIVGLGFIGSQGLSFLAYLVLVRLLTPRDYGLYAAGTVITGIGGLFAESGMLAALITREDRLDEAASTAFVALAVSGTLLMLGSLAISPLLGDAFHSSKVGEITAVLSGWLLIRALTIVPDALLQRRLSFVRRVVVDPLGVIAYAAASIPLAATGAGVWAMVAGAYASIVVQAVAAWVAAGFRPRLRQSSFSLWRELASFTRPLIAAEVLRRVTMQIDTFMLGRFSSSATLGQYRNGLMLAQQPGGAFGSVAAYVLLPAFARISGVPHRIARAAGHAYWSAYAFIVPVSLACLPLGVPIALIVLGPQWRQAGHAIAGLSGVVLGGVLLSISGELMKATGLLRLQFYVQVVWIVLVAVTVVTAALLWGLVGVAIAGSFSSCATAFYAMVRIARAMDLRAGKFFFGIIKPALASIIMIVSMLVFAAATNPVGHAQVTQAALLVAEVLVGAVVYCGALALIDVPRRRAARQLLGRARQMVRPRRAQRPRST
jgi:O-antigen/teichoic acid export membrane protein